MAKIASSLFFILILVSYVHVSVAPPPGLRDDQYWVPDDDCPQGGVYKINNNSIRCHCWGHQGYICEPDDAGAGGRGGRGFGGGNGGIGGGGGGGNGGNRRNGCPPGASVCVINNNSNSNSNSNANSNTNKGKNGNGNNGKGGKNKNNDYGADYSQYDN